MPLLTVHTAGHKVVLNEHAVYVNKRGTSVTEMDPAQARLIARQLQIAADEVESESETDAPASNVHIDQTSQTPETNQP